MTRETDTISSCEVNTLRERRPQLTISLHRRSTNISTDPRRESSRADDDVLHDASFSKSSTLIASPNRIRSVWLQGDHFNDQRSLLTSIMRERSKTTLKNGNYRSDWKISKHRWKWWHIEIHKKVYFEETRDQIELRKFAVFENLSSIIELFKSLEVTEKVWPSSFWDKKTMHVSSW